MSYNWKEQAENSNQAEKIPGGVHDLQIVKIVYGKKTDDGFKRFTSNNGDPQIMIIWGDSQARESAETLTLSIKAGWKLAKILECSGADLARMEKDGITPERFADEAFAGVNLLNRRIRGEVKYNEKGYADITPYRPRPGQTVAVSKEVDEIPI